MNVYPPGTRIGPYEIAGRPLMGGMGIVYVCFDHEEDRPVALKTFKPEYLPDRAARDRFLREGTHWVDLGRHPHVVRCYRVVRLDPEVYLVLELVAKEQGRDNASLRSWLTPGHPLPVQTALLFALQIARGMKHAVKTIPGFVHRDLKPENVLVGADHLSGTATNRLRVTDFGLAAVLEEASGRISESAISDSPGSQGVPAMHHTQLTHGVVGTPLYMAPEQWRGEKTTVTTDVYALGCILYEMLAGQHAAAGHSLATLERAHCRGDLRPLPSRLPPGVAAIVAHCLALEARARYGSWEQVESAMMAAYEEAMGHPAPGVAPTAALSREERVSAGWSFSEIGRSYLDIGKAEVALGYFRRAQEVGKAEGERSLEGAGLNNQGLAYADLGDAWRAIEFHEQALEILREIGDCQAEGTALGNLGNAYVALGEARRAIGFHEQALTIAREIGDRRGEGTDLGNLGIAYAALDDARGAIGLYEQALTIAREIGDRQAEGAALGNLGNAYADLGEAQRAVGFYEQYLEIAREIGDRRGEGNALSNLGSAYADLGAARRAIGYYEQALTIAREIRDRRVEGNALGNLGVAHKNLGEARQAIGFYEQALAIKREIGDRRGEGGALGNLGNAYLILGETRRAIGFFEQALGIDREIGDRRGEGTALGNLGAAYADLGEARRAIGYCKQALAIASEIGDTDGVARHSLNMAYSYAQQGELGRALLLAQQAAEIFTKIGRAQHARRAQQLVAQLQGGAAPSVGPSPTEILQQFAPLIEAVVAAARGNRQARAAVEAAFGQFERVGWRIVEPIRRLWSGERDEADLTAGIDPNSALIVREILKQLK